MTFSKTETREAIKELKDLFKRYDTTTVFVIQKHVSRSGMQRKLKLFVLPTIELQNECGCGEYQDKEKTHIVNGYENSKDYSPLQIRPVNITHLVAKALQWSYDTDWHCVTVSGCGMDMHFHTVYSLSQVLFEDGYKLTHETI